MKKRQAAYSLLECICVLALVAILTTVFAQFFVQGMRATQLARARAEISDQLLWISDFWQSALEGTDPGAWVCDENSLSAGSRRIAYVANGLDVTDGARSGTVVLPGPMEARFSVERPDDGPARAVLELGWEYERLGSSMTNHARFVACGGGRP